MVRWWCQLQPSADLAPALLEGQARELGIHAWLVEVEVQGDGALQPSLLLSPLFEAAAQGGPAVGLVLQLRHPLSPRGEAELARGLAGWLARPGALCQAGRPVLLLDGLAGFSHARFGPRRLRLSLQHELRRLGRAAPPSLVGPAMDDAWDCYVLSPGWEVGTYRRYLQRAHHGPWPPGSWIPAVWAPQQHDGGSAELYGEWLEQAGAVSRCHWNGAEEAPVLLPSWLDHQRWWNPLACEASPCSPSPPGEEWFATTAEASDLAWGTPDPQHLALLVHGFYPDRLADLLKRIPQPAAGQSGLQVDLYLSTPRQQLQAVADLLKAQGWPRVHLFGVDNRGRDLAPFVLHLLPTALRHGHAVFVKLHTKRSDHLSDGEAWAEHLIGSLTSAEALQTCLELLQRNPGLGLLGPAGTLMACSVALQANADHLLALCQRCGVSPATLLEHRFIAGSMMAGRLQALEPLCRLGLKLADFEPEQGQTDGTLAHALERWLGCTAAQGNWQLQELPGEACAVPGFGHRTLSGSDPQHHS